MSSYNFRCINNHEFEGWFKNETAYQTQREQGLLECPLCATQQIEKLPSSPNIAAKLEKTGDKDSGGHSAENYPAARNVTARESARKAIDYIENNFENVGKDFPEEARKIHYQESNPKNIYGQANMEEIMRLQEEGIACGVIPNPNKEN